MKTASDALKEKACELIGPFYFDPITLLSIISQIQLAARHPNNTGESKDIVELAARNMQNELVKVIPETEFIVEAGWNPDFDM